MKCGICEATTIEVRGVDPTDPDRKRIIVLRERPIHDMTDLWDHKRSKHNAVLRQNREDATKRRKIKEDAEQVDRETRKAAMVAGALPVVFPVYKYRWDRDRDKGPDGHRVGDTSEMKLRGWHGEMVAVETDEESRGRYPEPEIMEAYNEMTALIERLNGECADMLRRAWEAGTVVPDADIDAVLALGE